MKTTTYLIIALIFTITNCYSQWTQTDGPYGKTNVSALVQNDSLLIAFTNCGYFSKKALINNWILNSTADIISQTLKGDSLYIGTQYDGVKLIDLTNLNSYPININSLDANTLAHSDSCLYGGNQYMGFVKISNNGNTMSAHNDGLPFETFGSPSGTYRITNVYSIQVTQNYIYCGTKKGVFRSTPDLNNWEEVNDGLPIGRVSFIKEIHDTFFVAIGENLFYSVNRGANWNILYSASSDITSLLKTNNKLYISTAKSGIQYSENNGKSWNDFNIGLTDFSVNFISNYDTTLICGTSKDGIFIINGNKWVMHNKGLICSTIRSMAVSNNVLIANDEEKVYKLDTNKNWTDISPIVNYELFGSVNSMNDTIFLSVEYDIKSWPYDSPFIVFSPDNGITWKNLINQVPSARDDPYRIYCQNGRLYAFEDEIMYYTDDLGLNWTDLSLPTYHKHYEDFIIYNSTPFALIGEQLVKLDKYQNWIAPNKGLPIERAPQKLAYCDSALFAYCVYRGMYVSFDNGNNWTSANNGLIADWGVRDFAKYGSQLFVTTDKGVFVTNNFGQNWFGCTAGLKNLDVSSLKILNDTIYVGTYGNGIWKQGIKNLSLSVLDNNLKNDKIKIFPNPASDYIIIDNSNIKFDQVKIIDLIGRKIISNNLDSNNMISIKEIPNGTYIVELIAEKEIFNGKLIIKR